MVLPNAFNAVIGLSQVALCLAFPGDAPATRRRVLEVALAGEQPPSVIQLQRRKPVLVAEEGGTGAAGLRSPPGESSKEE